MSTIATLPLVTASLILGHAGRRASMGGFSAPGDEARCPGGDDRGSDGGDEAGDGVAEKAGERADAANIERAEIPW